MSEINVEEIMEQIRQEIKEKGLEYEILRFEELYADNKNTLLGEHAEPFDLMILLGNVSDMNYYYLYSVNRDVGGNTISRLIKKSIRKLVRFYVQPLILDQMNFNTAAVRAMNSLRNYIVENEGMQIRLNEMAEKIEHLENKLGKIQE